MVCVPKGDIGKRFVKVMESRQLSPKDLVEYSLQRGRPITYSRIGNWSSGANDPAKELLPFLAKFANASVDEILGVKPISEKRSKRVARATDEGEIEVPKLQPIKAGAKWTDPFDGDETMPIPTFMWADNVFTAPVEGDSMSDFMDDQDTAVFVAEKARIGMIVVARNQDGEMTIKQLKHNGREYVLHPLNPNPKYKDLTAESWTVEGYLVGVIGMEDGDRKVRHNPRGLYPRKHTPQFSMEN